MRNTDLSTILYGLMLAGVGSFISGCCVISVTSDCDAKADFKKYKTFSFSSDPDRAIGRKDKELIFKAIDDEMFLRGCRRKVDSADVLISISRSRGDLQITASASDLSLKSTSSLQQAMPDIGSTRSPEGTLVISVFDFQNRKLIWQGSGTQTLNDNSAPADHEAKVNYAVNMILRTYPIQSRRASYR